MHLERHRGKEYMRGRESLCERARDRQRERERERERERARAYLMPLLSAGYHSSAGTLVFPRCDSPADLLRGSLVRKPFSPFREYFDASIVSITNCWWLTPLVWEACPWISSGRWLERMESACTITIGGDICVRSDTSALPLSPSVSVVCT